MDSRDQMQVIMHVRQALYQLCHHPSLAGRFFLAFLGVWERRNSGHHPTLKGYFPWYLQKVGSHLNSFPLILICFSCWTSRTLTDTRWFRVCSLGSGPEVYVPDSASLRMLDECSWNPMLEQLVVYACRQFPKNSVLQCKGFPVSSSSPSPSEASSLGSLKSLIKKHTYFLA